MTVREVLRNKGNRVVSIGPGMSIADALARLVQNNIGSLPVVDDEGRIIGVVSERDMTRGFHHRGEAFRTMAVSEVMTCNPVTCECGDDVNDVMGKMSERRIAKLPVVEDDRLVGVVSVGDLITLLYERVQAENDHLISYIHGRY